MSNPPFPYGVIFVCVVKDCISKYNDSEDDQKNKESGYGNIYHNYLLRDLRNDSISCWVYF